MSQRRHSHQDRPVKRDPFSLVIRVMCALIGLLFGFAGGRFLAAPLQESSGPAPAVFAGAATLPPAGAPLADRIAATSRMDEDALSGVLAALHDEWVRNGSTEDAVPRARLYLRILFSRWTDLSGSAALKAALALKDSRLGLLALEAVMTEWALRDTLSASQSITLIPWAMPQRQALAALIRAGVQRSPAEALAMTGKIAIAPQAFQRRTAGAEWMARDASHALRFLTEAPGMAGTVPAGAALAQWFMENPAAFLAWQGKGSADKTIPLLRFSEDTLTPGRLTRLSAALTKASGTLEPGLAWLKNAAGASSRVVIAALAPPQPAAATAVQTWNESAAARPAPDTAAGWLLRLDHARILTTLAALPPGTDPGSAMDWLSSLPPDEDAAVLGPALARAWIVRSPSTAPAQLFSGDLKNPVRKGAAAAAVHRLVLTDPLRALEILSAMPLDEAAASAFRSTALDQLAAASPDTLLEWLAAHPGASVAPATLSGTLRTMAASDSPKAMQWIRASAPQDLKANLLGEIFAVWIRKDRAEALTFLQSLPDGKERDAAIDLLVTGDVAINDPFFAGNALPETFEHALHLSGDTSRIETLRRLIARMKQLNVPVESSLKHRSLRPADRDAILKQP